MVKSSNFRVGMVFVVVLVFAGVVVGDSSEDVGALMGLIWEFRSYGRDGVAPRPVSWSKDVFINFSNTSLQDYPDFTSATFCGDNFVSGFEECEMPGSLNNAWCLQGSEKCVDGVLLKRDSFGNCNDDCYCVYDYYRPGCSIERCGSGCETEDDCSSGYVCNKTSCTCSQVVSGVNGSKCGDGVIDFDFGEYCDTDAFAPIWDSYFCRFYRYCDPFCEVQFLQQPSFALGYELCDGFDNDCDGDVDEPEDLRVSSCGVYGVCLECPKFCNVSEYDCSVDWLLNNCSAGYEVVEFSCDFLDNDCDGLVDEGINDCCSPGSNSSCGYSNLGVCSLGTRTCDSSGKWESCDAVWPGELPDEFSEQFLCDGLDNDCDGLVDENCLNFPFVNASSCSGGGCVNVSGFEVCNYFDDDLDGEAGSPTSAVFVDGHYESFGDYCPNGTRCVYCDLHSPCTCPEGRVCGPMFADGLDNNWDAFLLGEDPDGDQSTPAFADGIDNDGDGFVDEGIDEGFDEDVREFQFEDGVLLGSVFNYTKWCSGCVFGGAEVCGNGIDEDCDGVDPECPSCGGGETDGDGDGVCTPDDCDDSNGSIHPNVTEVCGDGVDNDCEFGDGYVCGEGMFCPGFKINGTTNGWDRIECCSEACAYPVDVVSCGDCGSGWFNVCDRAECETCAEGCYFVYSLFGLNNSCYPCSGVSGCNVYQDEVGCNGDTCSVGDCKWENKTCMSGIVDWGGLGELQAEACNVASSYGTCRTRLLELGYVLPSECCESLGVCC